MPTAFNRAVYIDAIRIENFRSFAETSLAFLHPEQDAARLELPSTRCPNINLLVGTNGSGKTALLKAIALAGLGPAVATAGFADPGLARLKPESAAKARSRSARAPSMKSAAIPAQAVIEATFVSHEPATRGAGRARFAALPKVEARVVVARQGGQERVRWAPVGPSTTRAAAVSTAGTGLLVGYGAARSAGDSEAASRALRGGGLASRPQRVRGLFEDSHVLMPLSTWLPQLRRKQPRRFAEVCLLVNRLLGHSQCALTGETARSECLFDRRGVKIPVPALSDGCRALLAWLGDLLHHLCAACPPDRKLVEQPGLVLVDEVDLHLHPQWQMKFLPTLARTLPKLQFILTTHSPLLVGSVEWANIISMQPGPHGSHVAVRLREPVHGLDADQLLLTGHFGLASTRASDKQRRLKRLRLRAREGDVQAAQQLLEALSRGEESGR